MMGQSITAAHLADLLRYEPETGKLFWRQRSASHFPSTSSARAEACAGRWNARRAGMEAFNNSNRYGYLKGNVLQKTYLAHRVAWAVYYGQWPEGQIDHINGDRADNRIANLRCVSHTENQRNQKLSRSNTSGHSGVCWHKPTGKWRAGIVNNRRTIHLGLFDVIEDAIAARKAAEREYGFHPNHGEPRP